MLAGAPGWFPGTVVLVQAITLLEAGTDINAATTMVLQTAAIRERIERVTNIFPPAMRISHYPRTVNLRTDDGVDSDGDQRRWSS